MHGLSSPSLCFVQILPPKNYDMTNNHLETSGRILEPALYVALDLSVGLLGCLVAFLIEMFFILGAKLMYTWRKSSLQFYNLLVGHS